MHDLIFVSLEDWDDVWRRNQFLCAGLSRRFPDIKILFVGLSRDVSQSLRRGKFDSLRGEATRSLPEFPNITVTRPLKLLPNTLTAGRRTNEALVRAHIRRVARQKGLRKPLLWLNPHYAVHMAGRMGERAVVYDITDDWTLAASFPPWERELITQQDQALCRRADMVVVCSEALAQSRRPHARKILLLPNGVDADHYKEVSKPVNPPAAHSWPAPVFGYTGSLHEDRIDADLIVALARAFPYGSIVLIGPNYLGAEMKRRFAAEDNVFLPGPVPYTRLPAQMAAFDVCIVPHGEHGFTESLNPLKLWEYLACGKPIVSSNVAGFRDYSHLLHIASGPDAFVAACREALKEDNVLRTVRMTEAANHSWNARMDCLLETLESIGVA